MSKLTQEEKILKALKENPDGLHPTYFIADLHIFQYSARINGLREQFNCSCKNGYTCVSTEHIINRRLPNGTTKFYYKKTAGPDWEALRQEAIQKTNAPTPIAVTNSGQQLSFI
jgi:hypothetical protein